MNLERAWRSAIYIDVLVVALFAAGVILKLSWLQGFVVAGIWSVLAMWCLIGNPMMLLRTGVKAKKVPIRYFYYVICTELATAVFFAVNGYLLLAATKMALLVGSIGIIMENTEVGK